MVSISAKIRKEIRREVKALRKEEFLPAVLYGPKIKNLNLQLGLKEFEKIYKQAGESSLISLNIEGQKEKFLVLIHDIQFAPITGNPIHVDFYQPPLKEEIEVTVSIVLEGESVAVKSLGGTLVRNITEIEVKALPQNLPKEIKVNIDKLKTFEDYISISDLQLPQGIKVQRDAKEILISVSPPEKVEEEKPVEEKEAEEAEKKEKAVKEEEEPSSGKDAEGKEETK